SPLYHMLHDALMSAIVREPKTFNNRSGSERGLWQREARRDGCVPKTSVCGISQIVTTDAERLRSPKI
ncbi:hypothetical protein ACEWPM_019765, partial [Roseovarius sp. S4756]|uniref:hypothetical protein n=1 Tax=Roseovarius maritimus TaxID=3342637 RepID=UPI0037277DD4